MQFILRPFLILAEDIQRHVVVKNTGKYLQRHNLHNKSGNRFILLYEYILLITL